MSQKKEAIIGPMVDMGLGFLPSVAGVGMGLLNQEPPQEMSIAKALMIPGYLGYSLGNGMRNLNAHVGLKEQKSKQAALDALEAFGIKEANAIAGMAQKGLGAVKGWAGRVGSAGRAANSAGGHVAQNAMAQGASRPGALLQGAGAAAKSFAGTRAGKQAIGVGMGAAGATVGGGMMAMRGPGPQQQPQIGPKVAGLLPSIIGKTMQSHPELAVHLGQSLEGAAGGALLGGAAGYMGADPSDQTGGALRGALAGGGIGALYGGMRSTGTPTDEGFLDAVSHFGGHLAGQ